MGVEEIAPSPSAPSQRRVARDGSHPNGFYPHDVSLRLVPPPAPGLIPILKRSSGDLDPFFIGGGDEDLHCGNCGFLLALHVDQHQLPQMVFVCPKCGQLNETCGHSD
jgi:hypothetical protein